MGTVKFRELVYKPDQGLGTVKFRELVYKPDQGLGTVYKTSL